MKINDTLDDGEVLLQELLNDEFDKQASTSNDAKIPANVPSLGEAEEPNKKPSLDKETHTQWALGGNSRFVPVGSTIERLPAGVYEPFAIPGMWGLEASSVITDGIYILPDMATNVILKEASKFWASEAQYKHHNLLYKRGLILWGEPGGGKTIAIKLLMSELVKQDGVVIVAQSIPLLILCLKAIRRIEPNRNIIVVLEDIDEIINFNGESVVLSMLDGESSIANILCIASTNYPERLGARIINRPSRFDRRIYVGMPSPEARRVYLERATNNGLTDEQLTTWVADSNKMSVAHLRELVAAVYCLDQPYDEVIKRLQDMAIQVRSADEFTRSKMGFNQTQVAQSSAPLGSQYYV